MAKMRAKMSVRGVKINGNQETVQFACVADSGYSGDGDSENNTFARYTPFGEATFTINNPALFGEFSAGDTFYVDFTPAEK